MSKVSQFYQLSSILTGQSHAHLKANDAQSQYFKQLAHHVKAETLDELFQFYQQLTQKTHNLKNSHNLQNNQLIRRQIISSAKFGQTALNIIKLWEGKS